MLPIHFGQPANMLLTVLGFLCGVALSLRFSVPVLVLAIPAAWLLVLAEHALGLSSSSLSFALVLTTLAVQLGYITGIALQWAMGQAHPHDVAVGAEADHDSAAVLRPGLSSDLAPRR